MTLTRGKVPVPPMIPHPATAEPPNAAHPGAEGVRQCRRVLHELIDIGMERARAVHGQAAAQAGGGVTLELVAAFDRIGRAVRRCIALALVLSGAVPPRAVACNRIAREAEDAIQRRAGESEGEGMGGERADRLDASDLDDVWGRPVDEIIAGICRDLGVAAVPGTAAGHATLRARAAELGVASPAVAGSLGGGQAGSAGRMPSEAAGADDDPAPDAGGPACDRDHSGPRLGEPAMHAPVVSTGSDGGPGVTGNPTTPLLHAARFGGK